MACITIPSLNDITDMIPNINTLLPAFTVPFSIPQLALSNLGLNVLDLVPPIPAMPTIGSPLEAQMPTLKMPQMSAVYAAAGVLQGQMYALINEFINKITTKIPAVAIPTVPGLPSISLNDLLDCDPAALIALINVPGFNFSLIPNLPPLYPTLVCPELKAMTALQAASQAYIQSLTQTCLTLIQNFQSFLDKTHVKYPSLPTIPTVPTMAQILAMLPPQPTLSDLFLTLPGFPAFSLPNPLTPTFSAPEINFPVGMNLLLNNCSSYILGLIMNYAQSLPVLGSLLSFPTLTNLIGMMPVVPPICDPSIF